MDADGCLVIDKAGLKDGGTGIKTVHGDEVLAIDTKNAITIVKVTGEGYVGRLAIVKDPSRVGVGLSPDFDEKGATMENPRKPTTPYSPSTQADFTIPAGKKRGKSGGL